MKVATLFVLLLLLAWTASCNLPARLPGPQTPIAATATPAPTLTQLPTATPLPATPAAFPTRLPVQPSVRFPSCEPLALPPYSPPTGVTPAATPSFLAADPVPPLRALAQPRGMWIGSVLDRYYLEDPAFTALLAREFNMLVAENDMRWDVIHPQPEQYDFSYGDAIVAFAEANGMAVYGHVLVWEALYPDWLTQGERSREEWIDSLCRHIKTVTSHYRGHIYAWNVVNEAFTEEGGLRDILWLRKIGPEYIAMAFQWAHEADPDALLVYNDHAGEDLGAQSQAIYAMAQGLIQMGIPIHAIGMQMHVWLDGPPTPGALAANMQRIADLGLQVHITEMDVRLQYSQQSESSRLAAQAEVYRQAFATCLAAPNCNVFTTWGLTDRYSWIIKYTGRADAPLLFDQDYRPKPAYFAILDVLSHP